MFHLTVKGGTIAQPQDSIPRRPCVLVSIRENSRGFDVTDFG